MGGSMPKTPPVPPCPTYGKSGARVVADRLDYPPGKYVGNSPPVSTTYAFRCECGAGFTHTVKIGPKPV